MHFSMVRQDAATYLVELVYLAYAVQQTVIELLATICRLSGVLGKLPQLCDVLT